MRPFERRRIAKRSTSVQSHNPWWTASSEAAKLLLLFEGILWVLVTWRGTPEQRTSPLCPPEMSKQVPPPPSAIVEEEEDGRGGCCDFAECSGVFRLLQQVRGQPTAEESS